MKSSARQQGFTLIEILIVLAISAIMLLGVARIFEITKRGYVATEAQTRMQENARLAMYFITRDFRQAGLMGCRNGLSVKAGSILGTENKLPGATTTHIDNFFSGTGTSITLNSVTGTRVTTTNPAWKPPGIIIGTDIITIRGAFSGGLLTTGSASGATIPLDNTESVFKAPRDGGTVYDRLLITDCKKLSIVKVDAATSTTVTANVNLMEPYPTGSEVFKLDTAVFYVRNNPAAIPSLYRKLNGEDAQELIEGVENIRLLYGDDTDGDARPDRFVPSSTADLNMDRVVALRIAVMIRSLRNDVDLDAQSVNHDLLGSTITTNDALRRDVYTTTISFRNSVVGI